ncbi:MAG: Uma2 family endonuclease [Gemmatimonadota bacterium]
MEATRVRHRWTYAEFARLPSEGSARHEVIDGELAVTPAPAGAHQIVVSHLMRILAPFVHDRGLGIVLPSPIDVLFGEGDYFEPDVVFVRAEHAHLVGDRGIECTPDLVVEILSPSTAHRDRGIKLERYRHFGVPEYWIVDLEARAIEVWRLAAGARLAEGAQALEVVRDDGVLSWTPVRGGPTLDVEVAEILP